jgi:hypothetical protein
MRRRRNRKDDVKRGLFTALIAVALLGSGARIAAHHSFSAFDTGTEKTITGTVNRFEWTNPHTWVWVDVTDGKGGVVTWGVEGMSPNYLARRGWTKNTFKPGDKVTLTIRPMRDGSAGGMFVRGILADGKPITFAISEPQ